MTPTAFGVSRRRSIAMQGETVLGSVEAHPRVVLTRRSPSYWRVTLDHPPLNIFGPQTIPQLDTIITAIESDEEVKVVVFDSAVPGFFLTHYDLLASAQDTASLPPGPSGLGPLNDMLVRLSRAPVVSIACIGDARRASGASWRLPATCALRAARRPFLGISRSARA
jgi:enoyl-CoA hydratase/carnithine racemase